MYEEKSYVGMFNCYFCGEAAGILLDRRLKNSLPRNVGVMDMEPCSKCADWMRQGVIFISVRDSTTEEEMGKGGGMPNPHRTGKWCVVREDAVKRAIADLPMLQFSLKKRFMFITDSAWDKIGLPREEVKNESTNKGST